MHGEGAVDLRLGAGPHVDQDRCQAIARALLGFEGRPDLLEGDQAELHQGVAQLDVLVLVLEGALELRERDEAEAQEDLADPQVGARRLQPQRLVELVGVDDPPGDEQGAEVQGLDRHPPPLRRNRHDGLFGGRDGLARRVVHGASWTQRPKSVQVAGYYTASGGAFGAATHIRGVISVNS
ncbi:hypothetical protein D3C86_1521460 [compost metagenome]